MSQGPFEILKKYAQDLLSEYADDLDINEGAELVDDHPSSDCPLCKGTGEFRLLDQGDMFYHHHKCLCSYKLEYSY